jgi:hypothetical protein
LDLAWSGVSRRTWATFVRILGSFGLGKRGAGSEEAGKLKPTAKKARIQKPETAREMRVRLATEITMALNRKP